MSLSIAQWLARFFPGASEAGLNVLGAFLGAGAVLIVGVLRAQRKKSER